ncbi:MAG: alpha-mannosidase [Thalassobius sp.]|nr:alpha-mannosidase [Thalassovita sp.]
MTKNLIYLLVLLAFITTTACKQSETQVTEKPAPTSVNYNVHSFYYNWYENPTRDGQYAHWNHQVLPHWSDTTWDNAGSYPGNEDIGANFYPELGSYSSNDTATIKQHMEWLQQSGSGVLAITWWGKGKNNESGDNAIPTYLDLADRYGLKLAFHIEPFYKSAAEFKEQLEYVANKYGEHPALYKYNGKPFYYVYDSYKLSNEEWQKVFSPEGEMSVRNTELDGTFIGLWVHENDGDSIKASGFDGYYTYFASEGFVYGSTSSNWKNLAQFASDNDMIFIPCVGPGYIDTRIRPWNAENTKSRENGKYYEKMFTAAMDVKPEIIGITSFNEWHEGTQIEPAITKSVGEYNYEDYGKDTDPLFYIKETRTLIEQFEKSPVAKN